MMVALHAALLFAVVRQDLTQTFLRFMFLLVTSLNLSLGHPRFHLQLLSCEYSSWRGSQAVFILLTWLRQLSFSRGGYGRKLARRRMSSCVILSYHVMLMMSQKCLIMYACSFLSCVLYIVQPSVPQRRLYSTTAL